MLQEKACTPCRERFPLLQALELLQEQKEKYILVAVTNGTKTAQTKKLRLTGLDQIFHHIFISEDIGVEKPNMQFFDHVFQALNLTDKKQAIIIGDSLTSDVRGGEIAGIDACWFNPEHAENDLNVPITYEISRLEQLRDILK